MKCYAMICYDMMRYGGRTNYNPTIPYNPWNQGCGDKLVFNSPPRRKETCLQLATLSEGVGGDMARDTYEMTSPMRVSSYGLGVATHIFHQPYAKCYDLL